MYVSMQAHDQPSYDGRGSMWECFQAMGVISTQNSWVSHIFNGPTIRVPVNRGNPRQRQVSYDESQVSYDEPQVLYDEPQTTNKVCSNGNFACMGEGVVRTRYLRR